MLGFKKKPELLESMLEEAFKKCFSQVEKTLEIKALTQEGKKVKVHVSFKDFQGTEYRKEQIMETLPNNVGAYW